MRRFIFLVSILCSFPTLSQNYPRTPERDSIIMKLDSQFYKAARINQDSAVNLVKTSFPNYKEDVLISAWRNHYQGSHFYNRQNADSALFYFDKTLDKITGIDDPFLYNETKVLAAMTYANTGRANEALKELNRAKEELKKNSEASDKVKINLFRAFSVYHSNISQYEESLHYSLGALKLVEKDSIYTKKWSPQILVNIAESYIGMKDYNKAKNYLEKALQASDHYDQKFDLHKSEIKLAEVAIETQTLEGYNIENLENAIRFFEEINAVINILEGKLYLGKILKHRGNSLQAEKMLKESLAISKQIGLPIGILTASRNLGEIEQGKKNYSQALTYYNEALQTAEKFSSLENRIHILTNIASLYEAQKKFQPALNSMRKADVLKDSLSKLNDEKITAELETQYQTEKKEQEISLLQSQNQLSNAQKKNQRNLFLAGLGITSLGALFFFFQFRNRQKTTKKLLELDKAKSTFFANISHEFRTPLTLIKGPIEDQLDQSELPPNERKNLTVAKTNTHRLTSLVEQLLALSKLESGHLKLQVQPAVIHSFMESQAAAFSYMAQEKNIDYTYNLAKSETAWFDRDAMEKIVVNLLGNAFKYTSEGERISLIGKANNGAYNFSVSNSGTALSEKERQQLFARFYQSNPNNPGTGIGLALTQELVVLHHGTIEVSSTKDEGTSFTVSIPIGKESYTSSEILSEQLQEEFKVDTFNIVAPTEEESDSLAENAPQLLIVEDNSEIRNYLHSRYSDTYVIHQAKNGTEGLQLATNLIPDIIISDVMMPGKDGLSMVATLKEQELTSHIPVVMLTAKTEDVDKLKGLETGADAYITKPFNSKLLSATLNNLLENRRKLQDRFSQEILLTPKEIAVSSADELFIERLQTILDKELTNSEFNAAAFCEAMGVSRMQLHRKLKALTGQSTSEFLRSQRLKAAANLIKKDKISIAEVGYTVGFNDPSYFTKCFKREYGVSPSEYAKNN